MRLCLTQDHALVVSYATGEEGVKAKNVGCNRLGDTPFALVKLFGVLAFLP